MRERGHTISLSLRQLWQSVTGDLPRCSCDTCNSSFCICRQAMQFACPTPHPPSSFQLPHPPCDGKLQQVNRRISEAQMNRGEGEWGIGNGPLFHYRYKSISAKRVQKDTKTYYKYAGYMHGYTSSGIKYS